MTNESLPEQWTNREFAYNYLEIAETMVVGRQRSLEILRSFYRYFAEDRKPNTILDLGCGDGILTRELLKIDSSLSAILVDGSEDMLEKARESLGDTGRIRFIHASFQELMAGEIDLSGIDIAVSSLAIHHLTTLQKTSLFQYVFWILNNRGYFVNIDTVRSTSDAFESWHLNLWREQVFSTPLPSAYEKTFNGMLGKYTGNGHYDNIDSLEVQMTSLSQAGFSEVDCFFKDGIFAVYGGVKNV